jgi:hypothetical protein
MILGPRLSADMAGDGGGDNLFLRKSRPDEPGFRMFFPQVLRLHLTGMVSMLKGRLRSWERVKKLNSA